MAKKYDGFGPVGTTTNHLSILGWKGSDGKIKLENELIDSGYNSPVDTERNLNVLCTFNLCLVSTGRVLQKVKIL